MLIPVLSRLLPVGVAKLLSSSNLPLAPPPALEDGATVKREDGGRDEFFSDVKGERAAAGATHRRARRNVTDISADEDVNEAPRKQKARSLVKKEASADEDDEDEEKDVGGDAEMADGDEEEEEVLADFEE